MLAALRPNRRQQAVTQVAQIPAPVGGLNARDALASMKPIYALTLENFFPEGSYARLRRGYASHGTGMSADVQTLMTYHALNGTEALFAAANNKIWNVTVAGAATSSYSTSITVNKWQWINFSNSGTLYILAVNGTDTPLKYNGSAWSTNSITGSISSSANIINIFQHKERVWLIEKNKLDVWYLASQAISGAATKLPLGGVFNKGGQVVAGGTLSTDSGSGIDDMIVFVTDNGEAAIYQGTNPATDFLLIGVFDIGEVVGPRCVFGIGGDLIVLTTEGAVPMSSMINYDRSKANSLAVTASIADKFSDAVQLFKSNFGWEGFVYPKGHYIIVNIPEVAGDRQKQYIQNTLTGAWCKYSGMNANCWGLLNDELYFGGNDGIVFKADTGYQDNGGQIEGELKTAFNACGSYGQNKAFKALRPLLITSGTIDILAGVNVDFDDIAPTGVASAVAGSSVGVWGTSTWGNCLWGGGGLLSRKWITTGRIGTTVAAHLKVASNGISVQVNGFDVLYEKCQGTIY